MKFIKKVAKFIKDVAIAAKNKVVNFVRGLYQHTEATVILVLSALGLNALVGELPFLFSLPMWIEAVFVIPVLSTLTVLILVKVMEWRSNRRSEPSVVQTTAGDLVAIA